MERLLADDFVLRASPDIDRETWMREGLSRCWGDRFDIDNFAARVEGPAAVTSFIMTFYVNPETCEPGVLRSLITDVWTEESGTWRLRVRHSSPPPEDAVAAQFAALPDVPPRWLLQSELSLVSTAGNTSTRTVGFASELLHQIDGSSTRVQLAFVSNQTDDVTRAEALTLQARHGTRVQERLEVFARGAYARDRFAGIENRAALEGGIALTTPPYRHRVTAEAGVGFTAEERVEAETLRFGSATGTLRYQWQVAPGSELRDEAAVTADLGQAENWRASNVIALNITLNRLLGFKLSNAVEYRNLPVAGFERADMRTSAALVLTFRRAP